MAEANYVAEYEDAIQDPEDPVDGEALLESVAGEASQKPVAKKPLSSRKPVTTKNNTVQDLEKALANSNKQLLPQPQTASLGPTLLQRRILLPTGACTLEDLTRF